jgi:hypothetical protein
MARPQCLVSTRRFAPTYRRKRIEEFLIATEPMPCGVGLAARSLDAMREARAELVAPGPDCRVADNHATLEQQLFNVAQAQLKPEIRTHRATDDRGRRTVTVIKRFRFLHHRILRDRLSNVTEPIRRLIARRKSGAVRYPRHDGTGHCGADGFEPRGSPVVGALGPQVRDPQ